MSPTTCTSPGSNPPWKKIEIVVLNLLCLHIQKNFSIYWKTEGNSREYVKGRRLRYKEQQRTQDHFSQLCKFNIKWSIWRRFGAQRTSTRGCQSSPEWTNKSPKSPAATTSRAWQTHQRSGTAGAEGKKITSGMVCLDKTRGFRDVLQKLGIADCRCANSTSTTSFTENTSLQ